MLYRLPVTGHQTVPSGNLAAAAAVSLSTEASALSWAHEALPCTAPASSPAIAILDAN